MEKQISSARTTCHMLCWLQIPKSDVWVWRTTTRTKGRAIAKVDGLQEVHRFHRSSINIHKPENATLTSMSGTSTPGEDVRIL